MTHNGGIAAGYIELNMHTEELIEQLLKIEEMLQTVAEDYSLPEFLASAETFDGEFDLLNNKLDLLTYMATISTLDHLKKYRVEIINLLKYVSFRRKYAEHEIQDLEFIIDQDNYVKDFQNKLLLLHGVDEKKALIDKLRSIKDEWNILFPTTSFTSFIKKL